MAARRMLAVIAAATLVAATATKADAATTRLVANWTMNESFGARVMVDRSGHGYHGTIGREVLTGVSVSGARGYRFTRLEPNTPPPRPQHIVTVPDRSDLDPGDRTYAVTLRIRTRHHFGNIVQKGQATVAGGNFKIQIPNGVAQCWFRGSVGTLMASSRRALNDGRWHTIRCERTPTMVRMIVDGTVTARTGGWTGTIANTWPVAIGGKTDCDQVDVSCDYYAGDLDYVQVSVG